ncbi:HalOD1 output domain-containing protein [Halovivax limisalsi]|uniref:HalOD1 output domain-containing protein n=1 Tax=Halovivax limisalsi TaxID=1453760 RepID=UPI001FFDB40A|nr:HalOD1 output domain-containing protein [Halovivax limisalsi]
MTETRSRPTIDGIDSTQPVSTAVVFAIAETTGTDPLELPPLYDAIDPDSLDALFASLDPESASAAQLSFTLAGCDVVVDGAGRVTVSGPDPTVESEVAE